MKEKIKNLPMPVKLIGGAVMASALIYFSIKLWKKYGK
jgi:hypothetical protein